MAYIRLAGRMIVNVHSANAEGAVGNYMGLSKMFIVRRGQAGFDVSEEPVISGNMVKHWHAVAMVELLKSWGYGAFCDSCSRHVMYRSTLGLGDEFDYITRCAIEDAHGFLDTGTNIRRESVSRFSFLVPIEDLEAKYAAVTHNRVVTNERGSIPAEEQAMMVIKREHASGVYGFLAGIDLAYVGRSISNPTKVLPANEVQIRRKAAVQALANVLSGQVGAAQSRALPIIRTTEAVLAISRVPLPNLVHGFYSDYVEESARILAGANARALIISGDAKVLVVGAGIADRFKAIGIDVEEKVSVAEAIAEAASVVAGWP